MTRFGSQRPSFFLKKSAWEINQGGLQKKPENGLAWGLKIKIKCGPDGKFSQSEMCKSGEGKRCSVRESESRQETKHDSSRDRLKMRVICHKRPEVVTNVNPAYRYGGKD